jgi:PTS system mannose-specific IID component
MMVGAMTATTVNVPLNWTINIGQTSVIVGDVVNSIFPGILSIGLLFLLMSMIRKGKRPVQLIIGIFVAAMVGALIAIF